MKPGFSDLLMILALLLLLGWLFSLSSSSPELSYDGNVYLTPRLSSPNYIVPTYSAVPATYSAVYPPTVYPSSVYSSSVYPSSVYPSTVYPPVSYPVRYVSPYSTLPTPSVSANVETVNNYLLQRGGTLGGTALSSAQRTALMNPTGWQSVGGAYVYKGGVNTQSSYVVAQNPSTGSWNIRSGPQRGYAGKST